MSFHADILDMEPFIPHSFADLERKRAFPEGAMPEAAYLNLCKRYEAVDDVTVQRITYFNDGLEITGLVAMPKATTRNHSLVIYNRGGSGNFGILTVRAALTQFIPLARAGYVVVGSNYRGNDGGEGKDEFGGRDVDDVIKLHDIMRGFPVVDSKPCYTIGHSRGGMMTYLLIKRGLPIRAAIAIAAVADLMAGALDRGEMREKIYKRYIPNFEAHEQESLEARSAVCWPEKLTVPLLLLHGTKDDRVSHEQSVALAQGLVQHHLPHELILYENGNHALVRDWDKVIARTLGWLEAHA